MIHRALFSNVLLTLLPVAYGHSPAAFAQPSNVTLKPRTSTLPSDFQLPSFDWIEEPWTGSDKPYVALRLRVDAEVRPLKGKAANLRALLEQYQSEARRRPTNAQAQFAWAYAAFQARENGLTIPPGFGLPSQISLALSRAQSPRSYQYARMRFIMAAWWQQMPQLAPLSKRLLRRAPQDWPVQYYTVRTLFGQPNGGAQRALLIAQQMVQGHPNSASAQGCLATAYWGLFVLNRRKEDGDRAIAAMQRQLTLGRYSREEVARSQDLIETIRKLQAKPGYLRDD